MFEWHCQNSVWKVLEFYYKASVWTVNCSKYCRFSQSVILEISQMNYLFLSIFFILICNLPYFFDYSVKLNEHYVNTTDFLDAIKTNLDKALGKWRRRILKHIFSFFLFYLIQLKCHCYHNHYWEGKSWKETCFSAAALLVSVSSTVGVISPLHFLTVLITTRFKFCNMKYCM